jgi:hypothetical protein
MQRPEALDLAGSKREIEIEAHHRLGVSVDRLISDHAVAGTVVPQSILQRLIE